LAGPPTPKPSLFNDNKSSQQFFAAESFFICHEWQKRKNTDDTDDKGFALFNKISAYLSNPCHPCSKKCSKAEALQTIRCLIALVNFKL
jgi:hypothetical protein